jgi:hypothetical protein
MRRRSLSEETYPSGGGVSFQEKTFPLRGDIPVGGGVSFQEKTFPLRGDISVGRGSFLPGEDVRPQEETSPPRR